MPCAQAPPLLELGPSAMTPPTSGQQPSLGEHMESGYAYARACLRANSGIRLLLLLLQVTFLKAWQQLQRLLVQQFISLYSYQRECIPSCNLDLASSLQIEVTFSRRA